MAKRAGSAIRAFCDEHGLPAPSILLSSPLLRCVETSAGAAEGMGFQVQHYVWCAQLCLLALAMLDSSSTWNSKPDSATDLC